MFFKDLNGLQKKELKERFLIDRLEREENRSPSWSELSDADRLVSDKELKEVYGSTVFSEDDFFTSVCGSNDDE